MKMNKKAASVLMIIFEVLAVIGVIVMISKVTGDFANSERVKKINLAEDLAMMVNALVAVPGAAVVKLPQDVSAYTFILDSKSVIVTKKDEANVGRVARTFNLPQGHTADGFVEEKPSVCLEKTNSKRVVLRGCRENEGI